MTKTTALPVTRPQFRTPRRFKTRLSEFAVLMKPRVMLLAVFTAVVGMVIAPGYLDPLLGVIATIAIAMGTTLATSYRRHRRRRQRST